MRLALPIVVHFVAQVATEADDNWADNVCVSTLCDVTNVVEFDIAAIRCTPTEFKNHTSKQRRTFGMF